MRQRKLEHALKRAVRRDGLVPTAAELRLAGIYAHSPGVPACPDGDACAGQLCDTPSGWHTRRREALVAAWQGQLEDRVVA